MPTNQSLNKLLEVFRAKPSEWDLNLFGKQIASFKNSHGRKIDSFNVQTNIGTVILLTFSLLAGIPNIAYGVIVLWIANFIFNAVTLATKHPMHDQEETVMLYNIASKIPELSEPKGKPLDEVIEEAELVQPVTKTATISAKAQIAKKPKLKKKSKRK